MVPVVGKGRRVETGSEVHAMMLPRTMRGRHFRGRRVFLMEIDNDK